MGQFQYNDEAILTITLKNQSDVSSFFKIYLPRSKVQLRPIFKNTLDPVAYFIKPFALSSQWQLQGRDVEQFSSNENQTIYRLRPGQSLQLALVLNSTVLCSPNVLPANITQANCHGFPIFSGYNYKLSGLPTIYESRFSNFSLDKWKERTPLPNSNDLWAPNTKIKKLCKNSRVISSPGNNVQLFKIFGGKARTCQVE